MSVSWAHRGRKRLVSAAAAAAVVIGGIGFAAPSQAEESHEGEHEGGGDACTFFLEHMWANEDGIPLIGSFAHFNEYHTDPTYENLVLSLASGAIGNSQMPIIDIYGGPLGWIPIFNPSHVHGHGTDYVTLLTSCGGIGIPLNSNDLTTLNVPSAEELADLSDLILPGLPTPEMLTNPDYLWETTDASAILQRLTPETLLNMDEYTQFAGDHFDAWRLLWETAVSDVSSGNPTGILDVLQITENIHTLESVFTLLGGGLLGTPAPKEYDALLTGPRHNPPTDSTGQGECEGTLTGSEFEVNCMYAGLSSDATSAHLHGPGTNLPLETTGGTSGSATGTVTLTADQIQSLDQGELTINIHTTNYPGGEIGGVVRSANHTQSLGGQAWTDSDNDGFREPGEAPAAGVKVRLLGCDDDTEVATTTTNQNGRYTFSDVAATHAPSGYCVEFILEGQPNNTVFAPRQVPAATPDTDSDVDPATATGTPTRGRTGVIVLDADEQLDNIDAGIVPPAPTGGTLAGIVFGDVDVDGIREAFDQGVAGVAVKLRSCTDETLLDSTVTNANGAYRFHNVTPGEYCPEFDLAGLPSGSSFTKPRVAGATAATDSDVDPETLSGAPVTGRTFPVTVVLDETTSGVDAGTTAPKSGSLLSSAHIGGIVWADTDQDGLREAGEDLLTGVRVRLINAATGAVVKSTTTSFTGGYGFSQMPRGWYRVEVDLGTLAAGATFTQEIAIGTSNGNNSDIDLSTVSGAPASGTTRPLFYSADASVGGIGAGVVLP